MRQRAIAHVELYDSFRRVPEVGGSRPRCGDLIVSAGRSSNPFVVHGAGKLSKSDSGYGAAAGIGGGLHAEIRPPFAAVLSGEKFSAQVGEFELPRIQRNDGGNAICGKLIGGSTSQEQAVCREAALGVPAGEKCWPRWSRLLCLIIGRQPIPWPRPRPRSDPLCHVTQVQLVCSQIKVDGAGAGRSAAARQLQRPRPERVSSVCSQFRYAHFVGQQLQVRRGNLDRFIGSAHFDAYAVQLGGSGDLRLGKVGKTCARAATGAVPRSCDLQIDLSLAIRRRREGGQSKQLCYAQRPRDFGFPEQANAIAGEYDPAARDWGRAVCARKRKRTELQAWRLVSHQPVS